MRQPAINKTRLRKLQYCKSKSYYVNLPAEFVRELNLQKGEYLAIKLEEQRIIIKKASLADLVIP
ncbi:AbrB/MazE/SpoVT family DNA-binding domain-containing protein [Archaeoglobus veneficus]|uniref:SpoVT/AbrB domain-containing protein n=1 Tax=Archaeoglobus veneficus (strain DSM 11195 / SNP6) TaxID=693661 RepID=F2KR44_ARCVS|nr:AbrB/MazE/SpoVT family DNA-binding domain-containing protein [Archaeoglobus veneficus]AEA46681.1 SpoVT/AbrB domain-containing protein [Archaeoglobus veneficus SNP6]